MYTRYTAIAGRVFFNRQPRNVSLTDFHRAAIKNTTSSPPCHLVTHLPSFDTKRPRSKTLRPKFQPNNSLLRNHTVFFFFFFFLFFFSTCLRKRFLRPGVVDEYPSDRYRSIVEIWSLTNRRMLDEWSNGTDTRQPTIPNR